MQGMLNKKILAGAVVLVLIGVGAWYFFMHQKPLIDMKSSEGSPTASSATIGVPVPSSMEGMMEYRSDKTHFKITYPKALGQVTDTDEGGGAHTVVFDDGQADPHSFQIYVTPYSGSQITKEQFAIDEPSGVFKEPQDVLIDGVRATIFNGYAESIGETREVWFIKNGFLYEVVTYKRLDTWLADIMKSWKFI